MSKQIADPFQLMKLEHQLEAMRGGECSVSELRSQIEDPEFLAQLDKHLERTSGTPNAVIVKVLANHHFEVRENTIQRHRTGKCRCGEQERLRAEIEALRG